jgi:hypothetical protein
MSAKSQPLAPNMTHSIRCSSPSTTSASTIKSKTNAYTRSPTLLTAKTSGTPSGVTISTRCPLLSLESKRSETSVTPPSDRPG